MDQARNSRRWAHRVIVASAAAGSILGYLSIGNAAYAVVLPALPPDTTQRAAVDTELNAYLTTYLTTVVEARAASRAEALASLGQQADQYAEELAAAAELQAALLSTTSLASDGFVVPLTSYVRTSHFGDAGPLWETFHTGEDFAAPAGTPLVAIGDAVVTDVGTAGSYGLRTILTLSNGTQLWYCHQTTAVVRAGDHVAIGQPIGAVGATGKTTGPHLHLEVRPAGGGPIDPVAWFGALGVIV